ncbi:MAG: quinol:electron acceptor oxidoreductase subunit ActD [Elusimicrobiota bacterium]
MSKRVFAVVGMFDDAQSLIDAARKLKGKPGGRLEAYSPYPVHGIEDALGLRRSPLAGMVLVMGALGAVGALLFQGWTSAVDYAVPTGGKALFSWQAFVPVMFEAMVLFATLTAGLGMLFLLNRLPALWHPLLASKAMRALTRDRFALAFEMEDGTLDETAARQALEQAGARGLEIVPLPDDPAPIRLETALVIAFLCAAACCGTAFAAYWTVKLFPKLPPMSHMQDQRRFDAQAPGSMRPRPAGTVPRGGLVAAGGANPLPAAEEVIRTGRRAYREQCLVCHGALGEGRTTLSAAYGATPANLQSQKFRDYTDGQLFHAMTAGKDAMPSYAAELSADERWAVTHYIRALQRARRAKPEDIP